jgi:hypothetical protein
MLNDVQEVAPRIPFIGAMKANGRKSKCEHQSSLGMPQLILETSKPQIL